MYKPTLHEQTIFQMIQFSRCSNFLMKITTILSQPCSLVVDVYDFCSEVLFSNSINSSIQNLAAYKF